MTHTLNIWLISTLLLLSAVGCRGTTPVETVSLADSGVEVRDEDHDLSMSWPGWRGPHNNGVAPDQPLPTVWSESVGLLWKVDVPGRGHGSPVVVGDLVLLATASESSQQQLVIAYDRGTGAQLWQTIVHDGGFPSPREVHQKGSNANVTVACDGERIYTAFFNSGNVTATAMNMSGEIVWQRDLGGFRSKFGYAPSPILYKSLVIFAADNMGGGSLSALDNQSGEIAWRIARPAENSHSSPVIVELAGVDQLLIDGCHQIASYNPATGEQLWSTKTRNETTCGTIVTLDDRAYTSGGYPDKQTICLDGSGQVIWENRTKIYEPSMLATRGGLFAVSDEGIAYCWSAEDGSVLWRERLGGNFSASPLLCNGHLYVSDLSGKTYVFEATTEGYREIAVNRLGTDCYASPAVFESHIFLRYGEGSGDNRQEKLACIGS